MSVLMIFIDGVGLGAADADHNPFVTARMPVMRSLLGGNALTIDLVRRPDNSLRKYVTDAAVLVPLDACLGVAGLPQSATGQTTLLTGVNGAEALGRHLSGLPTPTLVSILREHSLFKQLRAKGLSATFANPFTKDYFEAVAAGRWRHSATTTALLSADLPARMLPELAAGEAVFHDMTGAGLKQRGYDVQLVTPREAGLRLAGLAKKYDFTLFEHFLTDFAGHAQNKSDAEALLHDLDTMIGAALDAIDPDETLVFIVSDHGNVEDLSVKTHTRNPVPALLVGSGRDAMARRLHSLLDVTPTLVAYLTSRSEGSRDESTPRPTMQGDDNDG